MTVHPTIPKSGLWRTPYGKGEEWADAQGPYGNLNCSDAIEAHGFAHGSKEGAAFLRGAKARQRELAEELSGDTP